MKKIQPALKQNLLSFSTRTKTSKNLIVAAGTIRARTVNKINKAKILITFSFQKFQLFRQYFGFIAPFSSQLQKYDRNLKATTKIRTIVLNGKITNSKKIKYHIDKYINELEQHKNGWGLGGGVLHPQNMHKLMFYGNSALPPKKSISATGRGF